MLRQWDCVHPYNAAQVLELRQPVDPRAASVAWGQTLEEAGLGRVEIDRGNYRHVCLNGEMVKYPVNLLPPDAALETYITGELNRPFDEPGEPPFRPFLIPASAGRNCQFGLVYQHWVADSVAIRELLHRWVLRMFSAAPLPPMHVRHAKLGYIGLAGLTRGDETPGQTVLSLLRRHLRFRRVRKVQTFGESDYPVSVVMSCAQGTVPHLLKSARERGVKVNDLLLAAAARACDGRVPTQRRGKRQDLAVGSIVDLRPLTSGVLDRQFGLFLGFSEVICRPKDLQTNDALVRTIARQNHLHRRRGIWSTTTGWLMAAVATQPLVPPKKIYHFLRKETPLVAGVSNVNLNKTWVTQQPASQWIARYCRISPTGPLAPIALAITSLGDDLQLSLTYRSALLTEEQARELAQAFFAELRHL